MTKPSKLAARAESETRETSISKSRFLWGLQCSKLLWHAYNAKHLIPEPDAQQQAIFDQGHEVGALAKQLFPHGIEVGASVTDLDETLRLTGQALQTRKPLFEAAFESNGGYCRVDILTPATNDTWDVIEVKSTTAVKDVHLNDLAFQTWALTGAGLKIRRCSLMHIDPEYVRQGEVDPRQFFKQVDLTISVTRTETGWSFIGTDRRRNGHAARTAVWRCSPIRSTLRRCSASRPEALLARWSSTAHAQQRFKVVQGLDMVRRGR